MTERCICTICTCGRHRCPHNRGRLTFSTDPNQGPCNLTHYREVYRHPGNHRPRSSIRLPREIHLSSEPFRGNTTYTDEYYKKQAPRVEVTVRGVQCFLPSGSIDFGTEYRREYVQKTADRRVQVIHPNQHKRPSGGFQGTTEYITAFQGHRSPRRTPIRQKNNLRVPEGKVDGTSTTQDDFPGHKNVRSIRAHGPTDTHERWNSGDVGPTSYSSDFPKKQLPPLVVNPKKEWQRPTKPFCEQSVYSNTYKCHPGFKRPDACRPANNYQPPRGPFEGSTTVREHYQPWQVSPVSPKRTPTNLPFEKGPFDDLTTYRETYLGQPSEIRKLAGNRADRSVDWTQGHRKFVNSTEYNDKFKQPDGAQRRTAVRHAMETVRPLGSMPDGTTYRDTFTEKPAARAQAVNPHLRNTFEDKNWGHSNTCVTTYQDTYKGEWIDCPAAGLASSVADRRASPCPTNTRLRDGHCYYAPQQEAHPAQPATQHQNSTEEKLSVIAEEDFDSFKFEQDAKPKASLPFPPKRRDHSRDFVEGEVGRNREGIEDHETNHTVKSAFNKPTCKCNASLNNNKPPGNQVDNNNDILTKDMMASLPPYEASTKNLVQTVELIPFFDVVCEKPIAAGQRAKPPPNE